MKEIEPLGKATVISRRELFEKVWAAPVSKVVQEFNISDVGLAKICSRHQIPRPPVGYWARVRHGQHPRKPDLPPVANESLETIEIKANDLVLLREEHASSVWPDQGKDVAEKPALEIPILSSLESAHPLVQTAKAAYRGAKASESGVLVPTTSQILDIRVSVSQLDRALRIWGSILPALESLGYNTSIKNDPPHLTVVNVLDEPIPVQIVEAINCTEREATSQEQTRWRRQNRYESKVREYTPTGRLCLRIDGPFGSGLRQRWTDSVRAGVESKLTSFVQGLVDIAAYIRVDRKECEERERRWEDEKRNREERRTQYKKEKESYDELSKKVDAWVLSQRLRAFAEAMRVKELKMRGGQIDTTSDVSREIDWILQQADRLDPLVESQPSILDGPEPSWW